MADLTFGRGLRVVAVIVFAFAASVCGEDVGNDSDFVGGSCQHDADCAERCVGGRNFPNGTCTVDCHSDEDCPEGAYCIDTAGGVCLLACDHNPDCRSGYACRNRDRRGHSGSVHVCYGD